ncbi:MAG: IS66 family insertion sequence element accessory protein TnpB [Myxococcales bacterium]|nr:IS66 family insertion sequence element accessory protein TnpB [Myxococcales bacterium]
MIPAGVEVFLGIEPIDLRWGFDRLAGLVGERLGRPARSGALFVFRGRRKSALKVLFFDGTGLCIFYKRLDRGTFRWPEPAPGQTSVTVDERALAALLDGIDVEPPARRAPTPRVH